MSTVEFGLGAVTGCILSVEPASVIETVKVKGMTSTMVHTALVTRVHIVDVLLVTS